MKLIKKYKTYVIVFFIVLLIIILCILKIYVCPFNFITGIPCPLCGITRAILSVFRLDFKSAFYYHALWPLAIICLPLYFILRLKHITINKRLENTTCIIIGVIFIVYYIIRQINHSDIVQVHFEDSLIKMIYDYLTLNVIIFLI